MLGLTILLSVLVTQVPNATTNITDRTGDAYEVRLEKVSQSSSDDGSSSSSRDVNTITERVIAINGGDIELLYDLPDGASADDRKGNWSFPARVLKPAVGPLKLLNGPELEVRVQEWLEAAGLSRDQCGRWIFTWNAFRIECDPESVLPSLARVDMRPQGLAEGAMYTELGASGSVALRRESTGRDQVVLVADMQIDAEAIRRELAESDVVAAEITGQAPISLESALQDRADERISGTLTVRFETDPCGQVTQRVRVVTTEIANAAGSVTRTTTTETTTRRRLNGSE